MASAVARAIQKILKLFQQEVKTIPIKPLSVDNVVSELSSKTREPLTTKTKFPELKTQETSPPVWLEGVRPHVRLIKFPDRQSPAISSAAPSFTAASPVVNQSVPPVSNSPPIGSTPRGSGIDDLLLPLKYRRRPLDQIEIEYIERGGPP